MPTVFLAVVKGDGTAHRLREVLKPCNKCGVHFLWSTTGQLPKQRETHRALLEHHESFFTLPAHGGVSLPMAELFAFVDAHGASLYAGTIGNENTFTALVYTFSAVFAPTDQIFRQ